VMLRFSLSCFSFLLRSLSRELKQRLNGTLLLLTLRDVQYLKGGYKEGRDSLFTRSHMENTRDNWYKLLLGRFQLDTRGKLFTIINHWNNLPREVVDSLALDTFKTQLDGLLGYVV